MSRRRSRGRTTWLKAVALSGFGAGVSLEAHQPTQLLNVPGAEIREPVVAHGNFIMNDAAQIEEAVERHRTGAMGELRPL